MHKEEQDVRRMLRDSRAELRRVRGGHEIWVVGGRRISMPTAGRSSGDINLWRRIKGQVAKAAKGR